MTSPISSADPSASLVSPRRPWVPPTVRALPALEQLTLQSGIMGECTPGGCTFSFVPGDPFSGRLD